MSHSYTGGVTPMKIETRLVNPRERLMGMTNEERAWRKQFLKDQELSPNEPRYVPEYWKSRLNPIRRFYRWPLDTLFTKLSPVIGNSQAAYARYFTGKLAFFALAIWSTHYYFKYNRNDWTRKGGWRVLTSKEYVLPGHPDYPKLSDRSKASDYADKGFSKSSIYPQY